MKKSLLFALLLCPLLHYGQAQFDIARKGTVAELEKLAAKDKSVVNAVDANGNSMLILACYRGNTDVAKYIAGKTTDINYKSKQGTALMAAVMNGNVELVKFLLQKGAKADVTEESGKTALIYAVFFGKTDCAKALIAAGANKGIKDNEGKTALDYAHNSQNTELIILLDN
ncbi:MAG: ankyrin repeat domain-containing protein [Flavobacterium sp.]